MVLLVLLVLALELVLVPTRLEQPPEEGGQGQ
jgi:hypothetical protein